MSDNSSALPEDAKAMLAAKLGGESHNLAAEDEGAKRSRNRRSKPSTAPADVLATVTRIIEDASGLEADEIKPKSRIHKDLGVDSLSLIDISVQVEDRYGVRIEEEDIENATVKKLADLVVERTTK